ncbi:MAG: glycosyltransferase [Candidatus Sericytochromatia bacterium]|nr:glycosyltransferase [Candidatus Sericytochromatia bacterium]
MSAVSILVPTYNRVAYLKDCLDSLLATTVPCEIIVADNASTDGTEALMATYTDARIRYVRHATNLGPFGNYNFLLQAATQEYLCLFGDDDIALPGCFEAKLAILETNPQVDGAYTTTRILDEDGNLALGSRVQGVPDCSYVSGRDEFAHLIINCCLSWQTLVFRRALYDRHGGIKEGADGLVACDWDYLIEISRQRQFAFLMEPTVGVRIHAASTSMLQTRVTGRLVKDMLTLWRKWLLESDDLPVITDGTWKSMGRMITYGVESCYGDDPARQQAFLRSLSGLQHQYRQRMDGAFDQHRKQWLPDAADLDVEGRPIFRRDLAPLALDTQRQVQFFHHPTWSATAWQEALKGYLLAFTVKDDVEFLLWHDPAQAVTIEAAGERVEAVIATLGLDPDMTADVQLISEPLDLPGLAALYATMHVIVPAGDPQQVDRGTKVGVAVMTRLEPDVWRRVAARFLPAPPA